MSKKMNLRRFGLNTRRTKLYPPALIITGLFSILLVACGDPTTATNLPAATTNPTTGTTATTAPAITTDSPPTATVAEVTTASVTTPNNTTALQPTIPATTEAPATPTQPASQTTASTSVAVARSAKPATPTIAASGSVVPSMASAIAMSKAKISSSLRPDQREWLQALPDAPGSKLYTYPTCGNIPANPGGQDNGSAAAVCQSNVKGTTLAVNNSGNWEITFSLIWPGTLPPGMARPQSNHSWQMQVSPAGEVKVMTDTGAPLPAFPRIA